MYSFVMGYKPRMTTCSREALSYPMTKEVIDLRVAADVHEAHIGATEEEPEPLLRDFRRTRWGLVKVSC